MKLRVAHIWRHPIKALGREELDQAVLSKGAWLPFDRLWAVTHESSKLSDGWMHKINFLRGVTDPNLMAIEARLDEDRTRVELRHPAAGTIEIDPDDLGDWPAFETWIGRIWSGDLPTPTSIVRRSGVHLTDVPEPWISLHNLASHRAVEQRAGQPLSIHRWRGNIWLDGFEPWEEFDWIGRRIRLGTAELDVQVRITRCKATMANPETGQRDIDTLSLLGNWGHQDFGVYASVAIGGPVKKGDPAELVSS